MIEYTIGISLFTCTLMICFQKWGVLEYYESHKKTWMPKRCDFCIGFWISFFLTIIVLFQDVFLYGGYQLLIIPFLCASLNRFLLK